MEIVNPSVIAGNTSQKIAERPSHLEGAVLGVLVNGKEFSGVVLDRITKQLQERFNFSNVLRWDKGFPAQPAPFIDEIIAANTTFVLNGVGH